MTTYSSLHNLSPDSCVDNKAATVRPLQLTGNYLFSHYSFYTVDGSVLHYEFKQLVITTLYTCSLTIFELFWSILSIFSVESICTVSGNTNYGCNKGKNV